MSGFVHESAVVDRGAVLGNDVQVWHFCHVSEGAVLGERVVLGQNVFVARGVVIGAGSRVQNNVSLYEGVEIEEEVFLGPSMVFTNVTTPRAHVARKGLFKKTRVGRRATIGANATILCGHTIGAYALIGAGAVVTTDVLPQALMLGNPARQRGWACRCGEVLRFAKERASCPFCGDVYALIDQAPVLQTSLTKE